MKSTVKQRIYSILIIVLVLNHPAVAQQDELYFIDAHSQLDESVVPLTRVTSLMQKAGVRHTILSARGKLKGKALLEFTRQHPGRITPAVRTKGNPYKDDLPGYYKKLKAQIASGKYSAMAEILLYHSQKGNKSPEVEVYPDNLAASEDEAKADDAPVAKYGDKVISWGEVKDTLLAAGRGAAELDPTAMEVDAQLAGGFNLGCLPGDSKRGSADPAMHSKTPRQRAHMACSCLGSLVATARRQQDAASAALLAGLRPVRPALPCAANGWIEEV